jgi:hypothetical protein
MSCSVPGCPAEVLARGWCRKHYDRWHRNGDAELVRPRGRFCESGCTCGRHEQTKEHRLLNSEANKGHLTTKETRQKISEANTGRHNGAPAVGYFYDPNGYVRLTMEDEHPLASQVGHVKRARKVLYDTIGPGPHFCHWGCGKLLGWGGSDGICADHLDGDTSNDDPNNLVPSCNPCNARRALAGNPVEWSAIIGLS